MKPVYWLLLALLVLVCTHLPWWGEHFYNIDEAVRAVEAHGWVQGQVPLVDLWGSSKPPGLAAYYAFGFRLFGRHLWVLQLLGLLTACLAAALVFWNASMLFGVRAGAAATALYAGLVSFGFPPMDWLACNTELAESVMVLFALAMLLLILQGATQLLGIAAGLALAEALMMRQNALVFFPFLWLILALGLWKKDKLALNWATFWTVCGLILGLLPWVEYYKMHNALGEFVTFSWTLPKLYAAKLSLPATLASGLFHFGSYVWIALPVVALGAWWCWSPQSAGRLPHTRANVLLLVAAGVLAVAMGGRYFGHYFLQLAPFLALAAAGGLAFALSWDAYKPLRQLVLILVCCYLVGGTLAVVQAPLRALVKHDEASLEAYYTGESSLVHALANYVRSHTAPRELIAVKGQVPAVYWFAGRKPGVRDFWGNFLTAYYGHAKAKEKFAFAADAWAQDLRRYKPRLVIDVVDRQGPALETYPQVAAVLKKHYKLTATLAGAKIYTRKRF